MPVRSATDLTNAQSTKRQKMTRSEPKLHPVGVLPLGNAFFAKESIRASSLGRLGRLLDELILSFLSLLDGNEVVVLESVSHACRAFALHEPFWKDAVINKTGGNIKKWGGSWKRTYIHHFYPSKSLPADTTDGKPIKVKNFFSDVLFLPVKLATTTLDEFVPSTKSTRSSARNLPQIHQSEVNSDAFMREYISLRRPCLIVQDDNQEILPNWTLNDLSSKYQSRKIRAEASKWPMSEYVKYAQSCQNTANLTDWVPDESPLYLFDPTLAKQMQKEDLFVVPSLLQDGKTTSRGVMRKDWDLFSLLNENRPDNAWIIAGPSRSGSGWHVDPNCTSAFNTVLSGRKLWLLLPPSVTPPGVFISEDHSSVTAPLSIIEWFTNFWDEAIRKHGKSGDNTLIVDVCNAGETIFVPSQWHHLVINLDESVAFTQNFCTPAELPYVLDMFKNRPEQISGFRMINEKENDISDEAESDQEFDDLPQDGIEEKRALYRTLVERLQDYDSDLLLKAKEKLRHLEQDRERQAWGNGIISRSRGNGAGSNAGASLWQTLKKDEEAASGFSFGDFETDEEVTV